MKELCGAAAASLQLSMEKAISVVLPIKGVHNCTLLEYENGYTSGKKVKYGTSLCQFIFYSPCTLYLPYKWILHFLLRLTDISNKDKNIVK